MIQGLKLEVSLVRGSRLKVIQGLLLKALSLQGSRLEVIRGVYISLNQFKVQSSLCSQWLFCVHLFPCKWTPNLGSLFCISKNWPAWGP